MADLQAFAARRLAQDAQELRRAQQAECPPLPLLRRGAHGRLLCWGVEAVPREGDVFTWDVTMAAASGPLTMQEVKMTLHFPHSYPAMPPTVHLHTRIPDHPNVFGEFICLDMLKDPMWSAAPYKGWSSAYRLSSILMQLHGFLLVDETVDQDYGGKSITRHFAEPPPRATMMMTMGDLMRPRLHTSGASSAGSSGGACRAASMDVDVDVDAAATQRPAVLHAPQRRCQPSYLDVLDEQLLRRVLGNLEAQDLHRCMGLEGRVAAAAADVLQRNEQFCFFSKRTYQQEVLGFGVHREWHDGQRSAAGGAQVKSLAVRPEYLSLSAFAQFGVRRSAWNAPVDAFLPLYLNPEHGERAMQMLPNCILHMMSPAMRAACGSQRTTLITGAAAAAWPEPSRLLFILAQAMNSLVVEVVKADKGADVPLHMSDAALRGFVHLHHLMLAVALSPAGQQLVGHARRNLLAFVRGAEGGKARHKKSCPDLGVLLVELLLVPKDEVTWEEFLPAMLRELLARQVLWAMRANADSVKPPPATQSDGANQRRARPRNFEFAVPLGEDPAGESWHSWERMRRQYESGLTGLRALQLTAWFGLQLARPATAAGLQRELSAIKGQLDECSGAPSAAQLAAFNQHARRVLAAGSWAQALANFRAAVRVDAPEGSRLPPAARHVWVAALRQAVVDSWVAGYHHKPAPWGAGRPRPPASPLGHIGTPVPAPASPAPSSISSGSGEEPEWREVAGRQRRAQPGAAARSAPRWVYAPDPSRLSDAQLALGGRMLVDWDGPCKPCVALAEGMHA